MQAVSMHTKEGMGMKPAQIWPPKERTAGKQNKNPNQKGGTEEPAEVRGAGAGCGELRSPHRFPPRPWERNTNGRWKGEKQSLCFPQAGRNTIPAALQPLGCGSKSCGEGVWHQRHFWFAFKAEIHGEGSRRLLLPKGCCCSQPPMADFLLLPAGLAVVSCRNGMGTWSRLTVKLSVLEQGFIALCAVL